MERPRATRRRWALTQLATAALLVLTLVGSLVVVVRPGRFSRQGERPAYIPAISATPATPATSETAIAEHVWTTSGGPELPLGDPFHLAIDPDGNLWGPDGLNNRFQIFALRRHVPRGVGHAR